MSPDKSPRMSPRLAISAGLGLATFGLAHYVFDRINPPASEQISQIDNCAKALGEQAVISSIVPKACLAQIDTSGNGNANDFTYTVGNTTYYMLPSSTMMKDSAAGVSTDKSEASLTNDISAGFGGLMTLLSSGAFYIFYRQTRKRSSDLPAGPVLFKAF